MGRRARNLIVTSPPQTVTLPPQAASRTKRPLMTSVPSDLDDYLAAHDERICRELFDFLRIPSVRARSEHDADTARAASWVAVSLMHPGVAVTMRATAGHPVYSAD